MLTTPAFLVLIVSPNSLIAIFGDQYQAIEIAPLISILAVGLYIDAVVGPNGEALLGFGRSRVVLYYNLIAVGLNLTLNILLIPYMEILGAAIASMIGYTLMNLLKSYDLYVHHSIPVVDKSSVMMATTSFAGGLIFSQLITISGSFAVEFAKSIVIGAVCLLIGMATLIATGSVTQEDKELLIEIRSRLPI
jgi:O-antigen/teichoic acid export membrane protein